MAHDTILRIIPRLLALFFALLCVRPAHSQDDPLDVTEAVLEPSECLGICNPGSKCEECEFFPINNEAIRWDYVNHRITDEYETKWNQAGCNNPDLGCDINDPTKGCTGRTYSLTSEEQDLVKNIFYSPDQKINIWCPECRVIHDRGDKVTTKNLPWTDNGKYDSWPLGVGLTDLEGRCLEVDDSAIPTEPYCDPYGIDTKCIQDPNAEWDKIRCRGRSEQFYVHSQGYWTPNCVFFVETPISLIVILAISVGVGLFVLLVVVIIVVWCVKRKTQKRIQEQVEKDLAVTIVEAPQTNWFLSAQEGTGAVFANDENAGDKFADQLRKGKVKLPTSKTQEEMYGSDGYVKGYMLGGSYAGGGYPGAVSQGYARKSTDLGTGRASSHGDASMASFMKTSTKDFEETATELWRQKQSSIKATGGNIAPAATSKGARSIALRVSDASASSSLPQRADSRGSRGSLVSRQGSRSSMASSINRRRSFKHQDSAGSKLAPLAEESSCEIESQRADFLLKKALAESQGVDISKAGRSQKSKRNRRASLRNAEDRQRLEEEIEARYGDKATEKKLQALALARMKADEEDEHEMRLAQQADDDSPIPEKSMERPWRPSVTSGASTPMEKSMEKPWNGGRPSIAASSVTEGASTPGNFEKSMELPWWEKEGFATIEEALQPRYDAGLGATDDEAKLESDEESPQGPARYMF